MKAFQIKDDIFWVGTVDFDSYDFHGYSLSPAGTTYNCYVMKDEKNVLFDTVKDSSTNDMVSRIKDVIDPSDIDYIVVNHAELDHSGALPEIVKLCNPEKIICSAMGKRTLEAHFDTTGWNIEVVKTGDVIKTGKRSIHFIESRMLHWPDSMLSYIPESKLLITNDVFGQNIASTERFSDEVSEALFEHCFSEYYHNIILPFSPRVISLIDSLKTMNLDVDMIAPDHGLIIRSKEMVGHVISRYYEYAKQKPQKRAVIAFDTMWHSTEKMAYAIADGLKSVGVDSRIMNLKQFHHSAVMTEVARCGLIIMGSPTHNNSYMPCLADVLTYMKGLRPQNKIGGAFGSYGWSGEGSQHIYDTMVAMGFDTPQEPLKALFAPKENVIQSCFDMGVMLGENLIKKLSQ